MHKPNIATRLLAALGIGAIFQTEQAVRPQERKGGGGRYRRNAQKRDRMKAEFDDLMAAQYEPPKHIKLARKAHMGEVGLPHGRRGLMVRRVDGRLRITS